MHVWVSGEVAGCETYGTGPLTLVLTFGGGLKGQLSNKQKLKHGCLICRRQAKEACAKDLENGIKAAHCFLSGVSLTHSSW